MEPLPIEMSGRGVSGGGPAEGNSVHPTRQAPGCDGKRESHAMRAANRRNTLPVRYRVVTDSIEGETSLLQVDDRSFESLFRRRRGRGLGGGGQAAFV